MSDSVRGHEDKPKSNNPALASTDPLPLLLHGLESVAPSRQTESPVGRGLEPAPGEIFEEDETLARLLRAVGSSSLAPQLKSLEPRDAADPKSAPAFRPHGSKSVVPLQQTESSDSRRPEPAPIEIFKNDETLARLSRAVESRNLSLQTQSSKPKEVVDPGSNRAWLDEESSAGAPTFASLIMSRLPSRANSATVPSPALPQAAKAIAAKPSDPVRVKPPTSNATGPALMAPVQSPPSAQSPQAAKPPTPESIKSEQAEPRSGHTTVPALTPQAPSTPQHAMPLFSVSNKRQEYVLVEDDSSSISPASFFASDAIDSALDASPSRPPAPVKGQLQRISSKIGVFASFYGLLDQFVSWIRGEPEPIRGPREAEDPRLYPRLFNPPLVALFWTGGPPNPHKVADISSSGLYLATNARWSRGTRLSVILRRTDRASESPGSWLVTDYLIVRRGPDGFGGVFIPYESGATMREVINADGISATKLDLQRFVNRLMSPIMNGKTMR